MGNVGGVLLGQSWWLQNGSSQAKSNTHISQVIVMVCIVIRFGDHISFSVRTSPVPFPPSCLLIKHFD